MLVVFLIYIAAGFYIIRLVINQEGLPKTAIDLPISLFFIVCTASLIYSADKNLTLRGVVILCSNVALFYILVGCLTSFYRLKLFIALLIAAGLSVSLLGLIHFFLVQPVMLKLIGDAGLTTTAKSMVALNRIGSTFGWPNLLAGFLMLLIPVAFVFIFLQKGKRDAICMAVITLLLVLAMFFTYSVGGWLSFIAASIICTLLLVRSRYGGKTQSSIGRTALLALLGILLIIALGLMISNRLNVFTVGSFKSRLAYVNSAVQIIRNYPLLGSGLETFRVAMQSFIRSAEFFSSYVHNSYLQIWAELGPMGFCLFVMLVFSIVKIGKDAIERIDNHEERLALTGIFCGLLAFALHNVLSYTLLTPQISMFWWAQAALMVNWIRTAKGSNTKGPVPKKSWPQLLQIPFITTIFILSIICAGRLYAADRYLYKAIMCIKAKDETMALRQLDKSSGLNPLDARVSYVSGKVYVRLYAREKDPRFLDSARTCFERAIQQSPVVARNYASLGRLYKLTGDRDKAYRYYSIAADLAPYKKRYRKALSRL